MLVVVVAGPITAGVGESVGSYNEEERLAAKEDSELPLEFIMSRRIV